jgi:CDGSH-type Zn-finger protein
MDEHDERHGSIFLLGADMRAGEGGHMAGPKIETLEDLRRHLQGAVALEHATLPPYLYAYYSIVQGTNEDAVAILSSVYVEEMLHMALAANLLNAVGGSPKVANVEFVPSYPAPLPLSDASFQISLSRFSPETLAMFMRIERPEENDAPAESDHFETIGQFYCAIEDALESLCASLGEDAVFCGDSQRQITPETLAWYAGGRVVAVYDLASARVAVDEIEEQGEGLKHAEIWDGDRDMFHPERDEVAHYFRFDQLVKGRRYQRGDTPQSGPTGEVIDVDWDSVYPVVENPRVSTYPAGSPARQKAEEFQRLYCETLRQLELAFNGEPLKLNDAISQMMELRDRAREMVQMPSGDGTTNAGPVFSYAEEELPTSVPVNDAVTISVRRNGPYVVSGGPQLVRKSTVMSEWDEPLIWRRDETVATDASYRLCRCGHSSHKPFCDGTHARVDFDGTETASSEPSAARRKRFASPQITLTDDEPLCVSAGFCHSHSDDVWNMVEHSEDTDVRFELMHRVASCPSGRLVFELDDGVHESDLPVEIGVVKDGPYWVTGGIAVTMSDGSSLEVRNRVTLCRCGHSANKPLCDGTHKEIGFSDGDVSTPH